MWLAFVAYITFLLDFASLNHYNAVITTTIQQVTFIEHLLCATYCANAFTNSISVKLQNNPFYNPHFIEEGEVFKKVNNLPEVSQLVNADPKFETLYF